MKKMAGWGGSLTVKRGKGKGTKMDDTHTHTFWTDKQNLYTGCTCEMGGNTIPKRQFPSFLWIFLFLVDRIFTTYPRHFVLTDPMGMLVGCILKLRVCLQMSLFHMVLSWDGTHYFTPILVG